MITRKAARIPNLPMQSIFITAEYLTVKDAGRVKASLEDHYDDDVNSAYNEAKDDDRVYVRRRANRVYFWIRTNRYPETIEQVMRTIVAPKNLWRRLPHQEATVQVILPLTMSKNIMTVVLDSEEVEAMDELTKRYGKPEISLTLDLQNRVLSWNASGEALYNEKRAVLHLQKALRLSERRNWIIKLRQNPMLKTAKKGES